MMTVMLTDGNGLKSYEKITSVVIRAEDMHLTIAFDPHMEMFLVRPGEERGRPDPEKPERRA